MYYDQPNRGRLQKLAFIKVDYNIMLALACQVRIANKGKSESIMCWRNQQRVILHIDIIYAYQKV